MHDKITQSEFLPQNLQQCFEKALRLEASLQLSEGVNMAQRTTVMNVNLDENDEINLIKNAITVKAMKSLYTELNRQKDLKWTYRKKYKDLQEVVTTTTEPHITLQQPVVVTSSKVKASPQVLKVAPGAQGKRPVGKGKSNKPPDKGKKNAVKSSASGVVTSTGPSANLRGKIKDRAKVTAALIQELTEELQAIEQESPNDDHDSEATQESDLEQEDSENCLTEDEGQ